MITINLSTSKEFSDYQFTQYSISSDAKSVVWEIVKSPSSLFGLNLINFGVSGLKVSTFKEETFECILAGTYVLKAMENDGIAVYYYFTIKDLSLGVDMPFIGERNEIDKVNGWGLKQNDYIETLRNNIISGTQIVTVLAPNTSVVGDAQSFDLYRNLEYGTNSPIYDYTTETTETGEEISVGIILKKYDIINDKFNSGNPFHGMNFYKVFVKGNMVSDVDLGISVDGNNKFYFNTSTHLLTDNSSDSEIGIWDSANRRLTTKAMMSYHVAGGGP